MSSKKLDRSIILSLDELEDDNLEDQSPLTTPSQPIFKKKGLKGKKLNQRKITLAFDASDEEVEQKGFSVMKRTKFKSPHSYMAKRQAFKLGFDHELTTETSNEDVKYTPEYLKELQNIQVEQNEDFMDIDEPVVVETTPNQILQEFHNNAPIDNDNNNDDGENKIPINEYGSDDNDNDNDFTATAANSFPADDDLIPDNDDAFIDDGPLNLSAIKRNHKPDIDEDIYDMELQIGDQESEVELGVPSTTIARILEPIGITEHLENLKKSIENLRTERLETEPQYNKIKTQFDGMSQRKEGLLLELIE